MDSYNMYDMTLAHTPRACKPFKIRIYETRTGVNFFFY